MKEVKFENRTFQYKVETHETENYESEMSGGMRDITIFYEGTETFFQKKFIFFGKKIEKTRPKKVFEIYANANNPSISKEWGYKAISDEVAKLERKEEIDKGFLI